MTTTTLNLSPTTLDAITPEHRYQFGDARYTHSVRMCHQHTLLGYLRDRPATAFYVVDGKVWRITPQHADLLMDYFEFRQNARDYGWPIEFAESRSLVIVARDPDKIANSAVHYFDGDLNMAIEYTQRMIDYATPMSAEYVPARDILLARRHDLSREATAAQDAWRAAGGKGPLRLRREVFFSIHRDFRSVLGDRRHPSCLVLDAPQNGRSTVSVPVEFVD